MAFNPKGDTTGRAQEAARIEGDNPFSGSKLDIKYHGYTDDPSMGGAGTDLHRLRPADKSVNTSRDAQAEPVSWPWQVSLQQPSQPDEAWPDLASPGSGAGAQASVDKAFFVRNERDTVSQAAAGEQEPYLNIKLESSTVSSSQAGEMVSFSRSLSAPPSSGSEARMAESAHDHPYQVALPGSGSSGDIDGDGRHDLVAGAGSPGGQVKVFDADRAQVELPDVLATSSQHTGATPGVIWQVWREDGVPAASLDHGTTVLAWARVDGVSPSADPAAPGLVAPAPAGSAPIWPTTVEGSDGNDLMVQGAALDETLLGLGGNDVFVAAKDKYGNIADTWDGGDGINTAYFAGASTGMSVDLMDYAFRRYPGQSEGPIALVNIQNAAGSAHDDLLHGDGAANILWGHDGHDYISGRGGNDMLDGGQGDDVLRGGAGEDLVRGGAGADRIIWNAGDHGLDRIEGFVLGEDTIGFGANFLDTADPVQSLVVFDAGADSLLAGHTAVHGWQGIAIFEGVSAAELEAAINTGALFGYQTGPLADDAPGGLLGPARPGEGRGGDDVWIEGIIITGENPAASSPILMQHCATGTHDAALPADDLLAGGGDAGAMLASNLRQVALATHGADVF